MKTMKSTFARLSPRWRGEIAGMNRAGMKRAAIIKLVKKKDGTQCSMRTVDAVIAAAEDPNWDGVAGPICFQNSPL